MIKDCFLEQFTPYVNDTFEIVLGSDKSVKASLIKAAPVGTPDKIGSGLVGTPVFSLVFRVPNNSKLANQMFDIKHAVLGTLPLFLVEIGWDTQGVKYETIFT